MPGLWPALLAIALTGCGAQDDLSQASPKRLGVVVIYTALDRIYSEPLLESFERETGIEVRAVYDTEAAKTTGLVSRLVAERRRPRCDVFWNNEIVQTIRLQSEGLLAPYLSPSARDIPEGFKDPQGHWTGFAARARVLVFNTEKITRREAPNSLEELTRATWRGRFAMAYPLFGTTATHGAALFSIWGEADARAFFQAIHDNEVQIVDGNMTACRAVAYGEIELALTDTDDAHLLRGQGKPIDWKLLDHRGKGALLIPNTVALIRGGPNPEAGRKLIDFLLSPEVEAALAASPSAQIPLRPGVEAPPHVREMASFPTVEVDFADAAAKMESSAEFLKTLFAGP